MTNSQVTKMNNERMSFTAVADEYHFAINKAKDINENWLTDLPVQIVVHMLEDYEGPYRYRFTLLDTKQNIKLANSLFPNTADGHTYLVLAKALITAFNVGIELGKMEAVKIQTENLASLLGVSKRFTIK